MAALEMMAGAGGAGSGVGTGTMEIVACALSAEVFERVAAGDVDGAVAGAVCSCASVFETAAARPTVIASAETAASRRSAARQNLRCLIDPDMTRELL